MTSSCVILFSAVRPAWGGGTPAGRRRTTWRWTLAATTWCLCWLHRPDWTYWANWENPNWTKQAESAFTGFISRCYSCEQKYFRCFIREEFSGYWKQWMCWEMLVHWMNLLLNKNVLIQVWICCWILNVGVNLNYLRLFSVGGTVHVCFSALSQFEHKKLSRLNCLSRATSQIRKGKFIKHTLRILKPRSEFLFEHEISTRGQRPRIILLQLQAQMFPVTAWKQTQTAAATAPPAGQTAECAWMSERRLPSCVWFEWLRNIQTKTDGRGKNRFTGELKRQSPNIYTQKKWTADTWNQKSFRTSL